MDFFRNLASKPDHIKAYYSFGAASILTGLVALIWISALPARFSDVSSMREMQEKETPTPLGVARDGLANVITATEGTIEPEESALGSLGNDIEQENTGASMENNGEVTRQPTPPTSTDGKVILIETKASEKKTEDVTTPTPSRTILIATTTVQKTE